MKVKVYRGKEIKTILNQIKEEHGDDTVILSTRPCTDDELEVRVGLEGAAQARPVHASVHAVDMFEGGAHIQGRAGRGSVERALALHGLDGELADAVRSEAAAYTGKQQGLDRRIAYGLSKAFSFEAKIPGQHNVVALIGPTGVGKTTTIAKLAARIQMAFELKIGLVSADTFRVGASHHLQSYAKLLDLPIRTVDPSLPLGLGLQKAIHALSDLDLVLVDTSGCSPREEGRLDELGSALSVYEDMEKILVLPAPGNAVDLMAGARQFQRIGYDRVILSKLDESAYIGPALCTLHEIGKPLAFLTTGQRVPEDIEPASSRRLGWMLTRTIH